MIIKEGMAEIDVKQGTFFNKKMAKLRDTSILFLNSINSDNLSLLDSTTGTGIRGIRYAIEAGIKDATLLDINKSAYLNARSNIKKNKLKLKIFNKSIQEFANNSDEKFDIIDLDPFGTPVYYLYDLLKVSKEGTIFMITATDTAVLCGAHTLACIKLYNSRPLHNELCKEVGIRILISYMARVASQFNLGIEPMLSIADLHYMRIFLRVRRGAALATDSLKQTGFGSYCNNCHAFYYAYGIIPKIKHECEYCGKNTEVFGPLWLGRLQDRSTIEEMLKNSTNYSKEVEESIKGINEELDLPFFYDVPRITRALKMGSVSPSLIIKALKKKGYAATHTQFSLDGIKTTASSKILTNVVKRLKA